MDIKSKEERSQNMSKIRSKNTKPEIFIRSLLHSSGYRFRVNNRNIWGNPDIFFSKKRVAIFIHGCYWHRHTQCKYSYTPKSNVDFWTAKFNANILRDEAVKAHLLSDNIRVLVIWECTVRKMKTDKTFSELLFGEIKAFFDNASVEFQEL